MTLTSSGFFCFSLHTGTVLIGWIGFVSAFFSIIGFSLYYDDIDGFIKVSHTKTFLCFEILIIFIFLGLEYHKKWETSNWLGCEWWGIHASCCNCYDHHTYWILHNWSNCVSIFGSWCIEQQTTHASSMATRTIHPSNLSGHHLAYSWLLLLHIWSIYAIFSLHIHRWRTCNLWVSHSLWSLCLST